MTRQQTLGRGVLFLWLLLLAPFCTAANFPDRPLTMIIGYAAGGSTDLQGRVLAQVLEEQLGQPVTVTNLPGSGGAAATAMLASSLEEGYVFQFSGSSVVSISPLLSPASYGIDSFTYVAALSLEQPAFVTGGQARY